MTVLPEKRNDQLHVVELPEELLVYDLARHRACSLNRTAALVWRHCDGRTTVKEMADILAHESGGPVDERAVDLAVERLSRGRLLQTRIQKAQLGGIPRRVLLSRLVAAGVLVPTVAILLAPKAAEAASPGTPGTQ